MSKNIIQTNLNGKTWLDVIKPSKKQLKQLELDYGLHQSEIKECIEEVHVTKTYEHKNYIYIVLHCNTTDNQGINKMEEINIFYSRRYIITIRQNTDLPQINQIYSTLSNLPEQSKKNSHNHLSILYHIIKNIADNNLCIVDQIVLNCNKLENEILSDNYKEAIFKILEARKNILQINTTTQSNLLVIKEIMDSKIISLSSNYRVYFDSLVESQSKIIRTIKQYQQLISGLTDIANILANHKLNDIMRVLTIISVSLLPLSLIAGILGMNFHISFFNHPLGFTISIAFMIILEIIIIQYFKYKKWL